MDSKPDIKRLMSFLNAKHEASQRVIDAAREVWRYWGDPHYKSDTSIIELLRTLGDALAQLDALPSPAMDETMELEAVDETLR